jgi:hypothetical protein
MATWRTLKRVKFKRRANEWTSVELRSRQEDDEITKFVAICKCYMDKKGELKYKTALTVSKEHISKVILALQKLEGDLDD